MSSAIRALTEADLPAATEAWNRTMVHDRLTEAELAKSTLGNANYDHCGALVACAEGRIVGLVSAVAPPEDVGRIAAVCGDTTECVAELLSHAEAYIASQGRSRVVMAEYGGCELAPGVDVRYEHFPSAFERAGFERSHTLDDMEIDLTDYEPTPYQLDARRRAHAYGAGVLGWEPSLTEPLRAFARRATGELTAGWFWEDWEHGPDMVVALRGEEVLGYANYWPKPKHTYGRPTVANCGGFGPIGVLSQHRGHGIGTWLLYESQRRVKEAGHTNMWAGWTNTPFYVPNGWHVSRQFAVWKKELEG